MDSKLIAVELSRESFVVLPEDVSGEIAGEDVGCELEWIYDAGEDWRARPNHPLSELPNV